MPGGFEFGAFKLALAWIAEGIASIPVFLENKKAVIEAQARKAWKTTKEGECFYFTFS